jgi:hypothetical protein
MPFSRGLASYGPRFAGSATLTRLPTWAKIVGGVLLTRYGLRRRSYLGLAAAALGGRLLYQAVRPSRPQPSPAKTVDELPPPATGDKIDESSWESFPASDAPAAY